jgi:hypothetical protein
MMIKISVVVPVKDGMSTLPDFIEGVKKQIRFKEKEAESFLKNATWNKRVESIFKTINS